MRDAGFEPGTTASAAFQLLKLNIVIRIIAIPRISRGEKNDKLKILFSIKHAISKNKNKMLKILYVEYNTIC